MPTFYRIQNIQSGRFLRLAPGNDDRIELTTETSSNTSNLEFAFLGSDDAGVNRIVPRDRQDKCVSHEDNTQNGSNPVVDSLSTASEREWEILQSFSGVTGDPLNIYVLRTTQNMELWDDGDDRPQLRPVQFNSKREWRLIAQ